MKKWYGIFIFIFSIGIVDAQIPIPALGEWKLAYWTDEHEQKWGDSRTQTILKIDTSAHVIWTSIQHQEIYLQNKDGETSVRTQMDTLRSTGKWEEESGQRVIKLTISEKLLKRYHVLKLNDKQIILWDERNNHKYYFVK